MFSKFVDGIKLCGVVDTLKTKDALQRDLEMSEKWAHMTLLKLSKANFKALCLGEASPQYQWRLCDDWIENSPAGKGLVILLEEKIDVSQH